MRGDVSLLQSHVYPEKGEENLRLEKRKRGKTVGTLDPGLQSAHKKKKRDSIHSVSASSLIRKRRKGAGLLRGGGGKRRKGKTKHSLPCSWLQGGMEGKKEKGETLQLFL